MLGVVGAGGLGQMLFYSLSLFQMRQAATVVLAMIGIVLAVDAASHAAAASPVALTVAHRPQQLTGEASSA